MTIVVNCEGLYTLTIADSEHWSYLRAFIGPRVKDISKKNDPVVKTGTSS